VLDMRAIADYLSEHISDAVPRYILVKELCKKEASSPEYNSAYANMKQSKSYRALAGEQWEDGSWGRFHTQDSKAPVKQKFVTTEAALRRSRELSLPQNDLLVAKCIEKLVRYVRGEETWTDNIEKHKDNGRGHLFCRPFMTAANINMFDPDNPAVKPLRNIVIETLRTAFVNGRFDELYWAQKVKGYHVPSVVSPGSFYGSMLLQNVGDMDDALQKQWLEYIWSIAGGIYYVSSVPPAEKQHLESRQFGQWLCTLELLSGFSLFPEFMEKDVLPHLLFEIDRLINGEVVLDNHNCRYADSWRDPNSRKTDVVLRGARVLAKCCAL